MIWIAAALTLVVAVLALFVLGLLRSHAELLRRLAALEAEPRDEMSSILHQRETTPYERSLDVHISHLRRKLDSHAGDTLIRAIRGVGYMFRAG